MLGLLPVCGGPIDLHIGVLYKELLKPRSLNLQGRMGICLLPSHGFQSWKTARVYDTTQIPGGSGRFGCTETSGDDATADSEPPSLKSLTVITFFSGRARCSLEAFLLPSLAASSKSAWE